MIVVLNFGSGHLAQIDRSSRKATIQASDTFFIANEVVSVFKNF
jgi:hypothetical protein